VCGRTIREINVQQVDVVWRVHILEIFSACLLERSAIYNPAFATKSVILGSSISCRNVLVRACPEVGCHRSMSTRKALMVCLVFDALPHTRCLRPNHQHHESAIESVNGAWPRHRPHQIPRPQIPHQTKHPTKPQSKRRLSKNKLRRLPSRRHLHPRPHLHPRLRRQIRKTMMQFTNLRYYRLYLRPRS
jgi:hypothetical protein